MPATANVILSEAKTAFAGSGAEGYNLTNFDLRYLRSDVARCLRDPSHPLGMTTLISAALESYARAN